MYPLYSISFCLSFDVDYVTCKTNAALVANLDLRYQRVPSVRRLDDRPQRMCRTQSRYTCSTIQVCIQGQERQIKSHNSFHRLFGAFIFVCSVAICSIMKRYIITQSYPLHMRSQILTFSLFNYNLIT